MIIKIKKFIKNIKCMFNYHDIYYVSDTSNGLSYYSNRAIMKCTNCNFTKDL